MPEVPELAIDAALNAYIDYQREAKRDARQVVWTSPSRDQVRRMLEAAAPFLAAAGQEDDHD